MNIENRKGDEVLKILKTYCYTYRDFCCDRIVKDLTRGEFLKFMSENPYNLQEPNGCYFYNYYYDEKGHRRYNIYKDCC